MRGKNLSDAHAKRKQGQDVWCSTTTATSPDCFFCRVSSKVVSGEHACACRTRCRAGSGCAPACEELLCPRRCGFGTAPSPLGRARLGQPCGGDSLRCGWDCTVIVAGPAAAWVLGGDWRWKRGCGQRLRGYTVPYGFPPLRRRWILWELTRR